MPALNVLPAFRPARGLAPLLTALFGIVATLLATWYVARTTEQQERNQFHDAALTLERLIDQRMSTYIATLHGGVGLFMGDLTLTRETFRAYVQRLELQERRPGIQGIGFAVRTEPAQRAALERQMRQAWFPGFRVWPQTGATGYPIAYLEPQDWRNKRAVGYDMYSEPTRREAMQRAIDTGLTTLSGRVTLVQEAGSDVQPGFLVYSPIYREDMAPTGVAERRRAAVGVLYAPFRAGDFFQIIKHESQQLNVHFEVYDGATPSRATLLYDSNHTLEAQQSRPAAHFFESLTLRIGGQTWTLFVTSAPAFEANASRALPWMTFGGGLAMTLLLFGLTWSQLRAREDALRAQRQAALLAEVSGELNTSLDLQTLMQRLAALIVSTTADYCAIDLVDEQGHPQRVALATRDARFNSLTPAAAAATLEMPMRARGRVLGVMTFANLGEAGRPFSRQQEGLLEEIANRAALAVDNAGFYLAERQARREAEEAVKARETFVSIASHELKTPLTTLQLQLDSLLHLTHRDPIPNWVLDRVQAARRQSLRINKLINQLLDVSRISAGRLQLECEPLDLTELVREVVNRHHEEIRQSGSTLEWQLDGPIMGHWDRLRLDQVVTNLLSNAIKYGNGKPITVSTALQDGCGSLAVRDRGIGISLAD